MKSFGPSTAPGSSTADVLVAPVGGSVDALEASKLQQSQSPNKSYRGILKLSPCLRKEVLMMSSPSSNALSHRISSATGLRYSSNSFDSLSSEDSLAVAVNPTFDAVDPSLTVDSVHDPIGIVAGDPLTVDDPVGTVAGDPSTVDDPVGTGTIEDPKFDDPKAYSTVATVPIRNSSASLARDFSSSALSPSCVGCDDSSPSSSPTSTPLLARRLNLIDEVEKKLGRPNKSKKKCGGPGKSSRKAPSAS